jgi:hypothetical protein
MNQHTRIFLLQSVNQHTRIFLLQSMNQHTCIFLLQSMNQHTCIFLLQSINQNTRTFSTPIRASAHMHISAGSNILFFGLNALRYVYRSLLHTLWGKHFLILFHIS